MIEHPSAQDEVVGLCSELIRIDSTNFGDGSGPGEREAGEYVAASLAEVGLEPVIHETGDRRTNVVARIAGTDPSRGALLIRDPTRSRPGPRRTTARPSSRRR